MGQCAMVAHVLRLVSAYPSFPDILAEFPELEDEDIRQALRYTADRIDGIPNTDEQYEEDWGEAIYPV